MTKAPSKTRPRIRCLPPRLKPMDSRTVKPPPRTWATRQAEEPFQKFYSSSAWQQFRAAVLAERGHRCEGCGATPERLYLDHKKELRDGGAPLDRQNVEILCGSCHQRKSAQARMARFCEPC